jgi:hypothetical protein
MKLRNVLLTGLALCVLTLAVIALRNPDFGRLLLRVPAILAIMTLVLVWNAYAAIRWTHPVTIEDSMVLHLGIRWGLAIGCAWGLVAIVPLNIFTPNDAAGAPLWFLGLFSGILLPFASGAVVAIKTGSVQIGRRVGFWSGVIGGLLGYLIFVTRGIVAARSLSLKDSEPIGFGLVAAFYSMFFFGSLYGGIAGTVGGWIGLRLYRTGEPPVCPSPSRPSPDGAPLPSGQ